MANVFISYSSADHDKALQLAGRLRADGYSVWIDESNIGAAARWTSEIVRGIEECAVFVVLLSRHSFASHNVIKELSLASEEKKQIVPVELEPVELTHDVKYQLAGIQRVPFDEYVRIREAVGRFTVPSDATVVEATTMQVGKRNKLAMPILLGVVVLAALAGGYFFFLRKPPAAAVAGVRTVKKLVVIPFENLSSNKDDDYFADGLTTELITTLSHQAGLQVTDRQTSMTLKGRKGDLKAIAKELGVEYVVDGTVRKQDKSVRITADLVEAETGKVTNLDNFEGTTDNLLELQTRLAHSIAFELNGRIQDEAASDTTSMRLGTKNAEAYSIFTTGLGYFTRVTSDEQLMKGFSAMSQAAKLDPNFIYPYYYSSGAYLARFVSFSHDPRDLDRSDSLSKLCMKIDPKFADALLFMVQSSALRGQIDTAIAYARKYMILEPEQTAGYSFLGNIYYKQGKFDLAAENLERAVSNNITDLPDWSTLIDCYGALGDTARRNKRISDSKPLYDLFLQRYPTNTTVRLQYALNLANSGDRAGTHVQLDRALGGTSVTGLEYYNIACCYALLGESDEALTMLGKSLKAGFDGDVADITKDPDFARIKNLPEFQALAKQFAALKPAARH